jgi:hypothetical protein
VDEVLRSFSEAGLTPPIDCAIVAVMKNKDRVPDTYTIRGQGLTALERVGLPARVKIGYKDYELIELTALEASQHRTAGQTQHILARIKIDLSTGTREAAETLQHEIMHAVWCIWRLPTKPVDTDDEEKIISRLSVGMATVWRDNPAVFAWIAQALVDGS